MSLNRTINPLALLTVAAVAGILFWTAISRVAIDTDIARTLPTADPVIADAIRLLEKNPIKDRIVVDIGSDQADTVQLIAAAELLERRMQDSGLFDQVGQQPMQTGLADLADHVARHLPVLFTAADLERVVAPRLASDGIRKALLQARDDLYRMDGIGQAAAMAADPLGLRNIVLARLAALNPAPGATIRQGRIFSADGRHLLVLATPAGSGTDTGVARALTRFFNEAQTALGDVYGSAVQITPTGAFRAALDNETIVKGDVHRAVAWATVGIGLLLLAAFSRPLMGLMALLPALAGTVAAFFVFSLFHESISIMVLGFGGAIISITVDHGIAYMLFVDRGAGGPGNPASREIRAVGLLAVLTSVGAFSVLAFSGFAIFEQLGQFTAMGIGFAFLFVHTVMPRLLTSREPDRPASRLWFSRIVDRLASTGWPGLAAALVLAAILAVFMRPHFNTDLRSMNCVSLETRAADEMMAAVWGDIFNSVYLMIEADDPTALQEINDRLLTQLEADTRAGKIEFTVTPSLFFPGRQRSLDNLAAWRQFWTSERIRQVTADLNREGHNAGFASGAFAPFLRTLATGMPAVSPIPHSVQPLLGISHDSTDGRYRQVIRIIPAEHFDHRGFYDRLSVLGTVFDPDLFSGQMGQLLFSTFLNMFLIIGVSLAVLLVLFFADAGLVITALLPLAFALVCTLGSLGLMGRALDIPALMLAVIILGMGVDYTLFMVRGYQRYQRFDHPHYSVVRTAICMAAGSTLVGFAVLLTADHNLLQSAGLIAFFGIGYSLIGSLLILPPLLKRRFERPIPAGSGIYRRYRNMEPYPRMFARFKQRLDPLFDELAGLVPDRSDLTNILDVGCGYGVPACWMADRYATALIHGIEPDPERVRVASLALGERGRIVCGAAPDLPAMDVLVDMVTLLDMSHYLQDWELEKTLTGVNDRLLPGGRLVMRSVLPPGASRHWTWYLEHLRLKYHGMTACYRDARSIAGMLERCGFTIEEERLSGEREDMVWHVAKPL